ncbi:hypothetical protein BH23BAC1_BH23BAC1_49260 [soil metagenome]
MNQLFSPHRFRFLLKLNYENKGKIWISSFGVILGLMLLLMVPILFSSTRSELLIILHLVAFFLCVLLGGALFTSTSFDEYSTASNGIPALMIPASRLEKFLALFLVYLIFIVILIMVFWNFHLWFVELANQNLPATTGKYQRIPPNVIVFFTYCYFLIQAVVFLGSIYFSKNPFVKSVGVILIISLGAFLLHYGLAIYFTSNPQQLVTFPFTEWTVFLGQRGQRYVIAFPESIGKIVWAFLVLMVMSLWYIAYIRLKEKEI